METHDTRFDNLLKAASALAYSYDCRMDSCEEWDDLNRAILAAEEAPPSDGNPRYEFKGDTLMRYSTLASGAAEDHACDVDDIEQVAYWTELLLSAADQLIQKQAVTPELVEKMTDELKRVQSDPNAVFFYSFIQASATVY